MPEPGERDFEVAEGLESHAFSFGALHGSAKGRRNVTKRIDAMRRLGLTEGGDLLDVGCATGEYTRELAEHFDRVIAIDVERHRLEVFRESDPPENVTIEEGSVYDLRFDDASYDVVTMIEVLEHLERPAAAMTEIARVLRPGGMLFLTTPNRFWPFEQHGVVFAGKRRSGLMFPGLTLVPPLHRRLSNSNAFTRRAIERHSGRALDLVGVTYMMPPLDSRPEGSLAHRVTDWVEASPLRVAAQTIVVGLRKPV